MKNLLFLTIVTFLFTACGATMDKKSSENEENTKKAEIAVNDILNDINELCKCGRDIRLGKNIQECGKMQEDIRNKYKKNNDQLTRLDKKVMDCVEEALKNK